jgi:hypothetical protein
MSCERARELIIDALVEPLDEERLEELQQHVAECESCAAEMAEYQELWQRLETVAIPEPTPGGLERLQQQVRKEFSSEFAFAKPAIRPAFASSFGLMQRIAAAIVLIGVGAILAIGLENYLGDAGVVETPADDRARYLLIMTETQEGPELAAQVQSEVQDWIAGLIEQGIMESGVAVNEAMAGATPPSGTLLNGPVSGFMVIRAADLQEARRIVFGSPIITYGGLIEIRAIRNGGSDQ